MMTHSEYCKQYNRKHRTERLAYYQANREMILKKKKLYREANKEKLATYRLEHRDHKRVTDKTYMQTHKDQWNAWHRAWLKTPKGRENTRVGSLRRRSRVGVINKQVIQMVYEDNIKKYGTLTCYLCNKAILFGHDHIEHRTPICRDGSNEYANLAVSCDICNFQKGRMTDDEYMVYKQNKTLTV